MSKSIENIDAELKGLRENSMELADVLEVSAAKLREGEPLPTELAERILSYNNALGTISLELTRITSPPAFPAVEHSTVLLPIAELEDLLKVAHLKYEHEKALFILEQIEALRSPLDSPEFLGECLTEARRIKGQLQSQSPEDYQKSDSELKEGVQAFEALLDLVVNYRLLSEQQWDLFVDRVTAKLGKRLALAAARGRMELSHEAINEIKVSPVFGKLTTFTSIPPILKSAENGQSAEYYSSESRTHYDLPGTASQVSMEAEPWNPSGSKVASSDYLPEKDTGLPDITAFSDPLQAGFTPVKSYPRKEGEATPSGFHQTTRDDVDSTSSSNGYQEPKKGGTGNSRAFSFFTQEADAPSSPATDDKSGVNSSIQAVYSPVKSYPKGTDGVSKPHSGIMDPKILEEVTGVKRDKSTSDGAPFARSMTEALFSTKLFTLPEQGASQKEPDEDDDEPSFQFMAPEPLKVLTPSGEFSKRPVSTTPITLPNVAKDNTPAPVAKNRSQDRLARAGKPRPARKPTSNEEDMVFAPSTLLALPTKKEATPTLQQKALSETPPSPTPSKEDLLEISFFGELALAEKDNDFDSKERQNAIPPTDSREWAQLGSKVDLPVWQSPKEIDEGLAQEDHKTSILGFQAEYNPVEQEQRLIFEPYQYEFSANWKTRKFAHKLIEARKEGNCSRKDLLHLLWGLIGEERESVSFHMADYITTKWGSVRPNLPPWLIGMTALGSRIGQEANGIEQSLLEAFDACNVEDLLMTAPDYWKQSVRYLLIASSLPAALLLPDSKAAKILQAASPEGETPESIWEYCQKVLHYKHTEPSLRSQLQQLSGVDASDEDSESPLSESLEQFLQELDDLQNTVDEELTKLLEEHKEHTILRAGLNRLEKCFSYLKKALKGEFPPSKSNIYLVLHEALQHSPHIITNEWLEPQHIPMERFLDELLQITATQDKRWYEWRGVFAKRLELYDFPGLKYLLYYLEKTKRVPQKELQRFHKEYQAKLGKAHTHLEKSLDEFEQLLQKASSSGLPEIEQEAISEQLEQIRSDLPNILHVKEAEDSLAKLQVELSEKSTPQHTPPNDPSTPSRQQLISTD